MQIKKIKIKAFHIPHGSNTSPFSFKTSILSIKQHKKKISIPAKNYQNFQKKKKLAPLISRSRPRNGVPDKKKKKYLYEETLIRVCERRKRDEGWLSIVIYDFIYKQGYNVYIGPLKYLNSKQIASNSHFQKM